MTNKPIEEAFCAARRLADKLGVPQNGFFMVGGPQGCPDGCYSQIDHMKGTRDLHNKWRYESNKLIKRLRSKQP